MAITRDELETRTRQFALRVMKLCDALPNTASGRAIGNQLVRSATSTAANYRAARRGRSRKEFVAKLSIVVEEADESLFWIEMIMEAQMMKSDRVEPLHDEAEQLLKIFATSRRTAATSPNRQITKLPNTPS